MPILPARHGGQRQTLFLFEHQPQVARRLVQRICRLGQGSKILGGGQRLQPRIAGQIQQLRSGQVVAKKQAGGFRQLVRLVENHRVAGGQQLRHAFVTQHHIGKKQMVIDHHHVGLHGLGPRFEHKTIAMRRAFLPQTVVAGRSHLQPHRRVFRHIGQPAAVAGQRHLSVVLDFVQMANVLTAGKTPVAQGLLQMVMANVIGAPLQQGQRQRRTQRLAHPWQVFLEELVLQVFGAGGNNHLAAVQQRGHQVSESFASAGTRLSHQHGVVLNGRRHGQRHGLLRGTRTKTVHALGQRT